MYKGNVIVIRGHAGSGKSTIAAEVMRRLRGSGERVCYIDLDYFSWVMPGGDKEQSNGPVSVLSATFTKALVKKLVDEMLFSAISTAVKCDFNVVFEGVLSIGRTRDLFERLMAVPTIKCHYIYLDVPLDITLERHRGREKSKYIPEEDMIRWRKKDRDEKTHYPNELVVLGGTLSVADAAVTIENHFKKFATLDETSSLLGKRKVESEEISADNSNNDCFKKEKTCG